MSSNGRSFARFSSKVLLAQTRGAAIIAVAGRFQPPSGASKYHITQTQFAELKEL